MDQDLNVICHEGVVGGTCCSPSESSSQLHEATMEQSLEAWPCGHDASSMSSPLSLYTGRRVRRTASTYTYAHKHNHPRAHNSHSHHTNTDTNNVSVYVLSCADKCPPTQEAEEECQQCVCACGVLCVCAQVKEACQKLH